MDENEKLVRASYQTYVDKDRAKLETLIAEPFSFTSPYDDHIDRKTYFERCWPNSENIRDFAFERIWVRGDEAFVTYTGTRNDGTRFTNTEFLRLGGGQIKAVEVYFGWDLKP